ncbi:hypothetical protein D917_00713 [Trichinella nativa]|uniref:Uncharacterized protein n=1 Tax=Trichinella nativa TaxID=6335 RepID=A0A1Y3E9B2_9BILA|nr:hypothetical protein D917_00713 [Trichinella nativa]
MNDDVSIEESIGTSRMRGKKMAFSCSPAGVARNKVEKKAICSKCTVFYATASQPTTALDIIYHFLQNETSLHMPIHLKKPKLVQHITPHVKT